MLMPRGGLPVLILLVLVECFVTVSVEVLTLRQLMPFVGNSVVVTSLIIGIFLLFLALGYQRGGSRSGDFHRILCRNFLLAAVWTGIGLCYPFIQGLFRFLAGLGITGLPALTIYLLLVTSPLVWLLGQTVPMAAHLFPDTRVGPVSGRVLFVSTLGSFLGSVLTTLVLMNWLGVGATVFIDTLLLAGLALLVAGRSRALAGLAMAGCLGLAYGLNVHYNRSVFVADNAHGNYRVVDRGGDRELLVNNSFSSRIGADGGNYWYIETLRRLLAEAGVYDGEVLVLGAGGFTLSRPGETNRYTYVDIDPEIRAIVAEHFNPRINGAFAGEDARIFVLRDARRYDAIVSDVYLNSVAIPGHLLTVEHFRALAGRLKDGGIALFNVILNPFMTDPYSRRVDNTLRAVFPDCMALPRFFENAATNVIYACRRHPAGADDATIYTDDRNSVSFDMTRLR
ncbi:MAG: fused MFS/spermidine synthase [Pseudomonadota bacterium]|nr:fused MFS/spermidine synthase [Pseudomonadota bacterium]